MSKINIQVETNPKSLSVDVDGEQIENITSVWIDRFDNSFGEERLSLTFVTEEDDEDNKISKRTVFSTIGSAFAQDKAFSGEKGQTTLKGFMSYEVGVEDQIAEFFRAQNIYGV